MRQVGSSETATHLARATSSGILDSQRRNRLLADDAEFEVSVDLVFTPYVRSLEPGIEPDPHLLDKVLEALRHSLRGEIRRRGLWHAPPSYFGIIGQTTWWQGDGFEELLHECYVYNFCDRQRALKRQLKAKNNIESLVRGNVRRFLQATQATHDPLGARIFRTLREATRRLVDAGAIQILEGDPEIRNETLLGFATGAGLEETPQAVEEHVRSWGDDLLPGLVTAVGRGVAKVLARMQDHLSRLQDQGIEVFRFRDVHGPLRHDVKERCGRVWARPGEGTGIEEEGGSLGFTSVSLVMPETDLEDQESLQQLFECMFSSIDSLGKTRKTKRYLLAFWRFLLDHIAERPASELNATGKDKIASDQRLGEFLGIPRERFRDLRTVLGELITGCRSRSSGKVSVR